MAATLICYGLYVIDFLHTAADHSRLLMLTFPVVVFGVFRYHHLAETTRMGDKPEEVLLNEDDLYANFDALKQNLAVVPQRDVLHDVLPLYRAAS